MTNEEHCTDCNGEVAVQVEECPRERTRSASSAREKVGRIVWGLRLGGIEPSEGIDQIVSILQDEYKRMAPDSFDWNRVYLEGWHDCHRAVIALLESK